MKASGKEAQILHSVSYYSLYSEGTFALSAPLKKNPLLASCIRKEFHGNSEQACFTFEVVSSFLATDKKLQVVFSYLFFQEQQNPSDP